MLNIYLSQITDTHSKLGLPSDVLYSIPWVGRANSVISNPADPLSWDKKLTNLLEAGVKLLVSGLMAIGNFLSNVWQAIVEWGQKAIGALQAAAEAVKNAVAKVIQLAAEVMKEIVLITLKTVFLGLDVFKTFMPELVIDTSNLQLSMTTSLLSFNVDINIVYVYDRYFDIDLPVVNINGQVTTADFTTPINIYFGILNPYYSDVEMFGIDGLGSVMLSLFSSRRTINLNSAGLDFNSYEFKKGFVLALAPHVFALAYLSKIKITNEVPKIIALQILMFIIDFFTLCSIALQPREGYRRSNAKWGFIIGEVLLMAMIFMVLKAREKIKDILDYARVFIAFILALLQVHTINSEEVDLFMNNVIIKGVLAAVTISISLATKLKGNNFHTEIYSLYRIIPILGALYIY